MHSATANVLPPAGHTVVLVRRGNGRAWQANPRGTYAETGGIAGGTLVIQLIRGGTSKLTEVDLSTRKLTALPFAEGSRAWVWRPSVSGRRLLYGSIDYAARSYSIVLADRRTGAVRTLAAVDGHAAYAAPGQVNGRYAVWIGCPDNACRAYRYDIRTGEQVAMPLLGGYAYSQFGPSVTSDGTVYYGNMRECGDVRLVRWRRGVATTILRFPPHTAFAYSYAVDTRHPTIYYDRVGCDRDDRSSIYRVVDR
jgi:nitrite reductase/ring-hydroxylating ferredoxin subunit